MKVRITRLLLAVFAYTACMSVASCDKSSAEKTPNRERADNARDFLQRELTRPMNIGGTSNQTDFVQKVYVPAVRRASASLDKLERGDFELLPIAAFVRKFDGDIILWMLWLQRDNSQPILELKDKDGPFASFRLVTPNAGADTHASTYVRGQVIKLSEASATSFEGSGTPVVRIKRAPELSSVRVKIGLDAKDAGRSSVEMEAQLFPLHGDITLPATSQKSD